MTLNCLTVNRLVSPILILTDGGTEMVNTNLSCHLQVVLGWSKTPQKEKGLAQMSKRLTPPTLHQSCQGGISDIVTTAQNEGKAVAIIAC